MRIAAGAGGPLLLIVALAWPLLFTDATFNKDWLNNLWYVWHQGQAIQAGHAPSLFVNYSGGVFYPFYAFYGGTLYVLTGTLSLALGDAPLQAYILTLPAGLCRRLRRLAVDRAHVRRPGLAGACPRPSCSSPRARTSR